MINTPGLKGRIVGAGLTQQKVAQLIGLSTPTLSAKINNKTPMTLCEAEKISALLEIGADEFGKIFLAK